MSTYYQKKGNLSYLATTQDLIEDLGAAAITLYTEDTDYPKANLQTQPMADTCRITTPWKIRLDFGAAINPRAWFFLNHNILGGNWTIKSYDAAWAAPHQTRTVTYREFDTKYYYRDWDARQLWELNFSMCTRKDGAAYLELGKLMVGHNLNFFSRNYSPGMGRGRGHNVLHQETEFGVEWAYVKQGPINNFHFSFNPTIKETFLDEMIAFHDAVDGGGFPFVMVPDNDGSSEVYYMKAQDMIGWEEAFQRGLVRNLELDCREMSRGAVQTA